MVCMVEGRASVFSGNTVIFMHVVSIYNCRDLKVFYLMIFNIVPTLDE